MEAFTADNLAVVVDLLKQDQERNINILNFIDAYTVHSFQRVGDSVLLRGVSDRPWVFICSDSQTELRQLVDKLDKDVNFAAIEDWMIPLLTEHRDVVWDLSMIQFILPKDAVLPKPLHRDAALKTDDALYVYENSDYRDYVTLEYIEDRIARGPSAAIYEKDQLVAWALTQDDGAIGSLHVLDSHRNKGYGYQITLALSARLRNQGKTPFAYVRKDNAKAIKLMIKIGFVEQKRVHWFQLA